MVEVKPGTKVVEVDVRMLHADVLLTLLKNIEDHVGEAAQRRCVPLVDAVELARLLRALIGHAPTHHPLMAPETAMTVGASSVLRLGHWWGPLDDPEMVKAKQTYERFGR